MHWLKFEWVLTGKTCRDRFNTHNQNTDAHNMCACVCVIAHTHLHMHVKIHKLMYKYIYIYTKYTYIHILSFTNTQINKYINT